MSIEMQITNKTLLLTPFSILGVQQTFGMVLSAPLDAVKAALATPEALDEILLVKDYYSEEYLRQFNQAGYLAMLCISAPNNFWYNALNDGGTFFIDKALEDVTGKDIPDSPLGIRMDLVANVIIHSPPRRFRLNSSLYASFADRFDQSIIRLPGPRSQDPLGRSEFQEEGDVCEFSPG